MLLPFHLTSLGGTCRHTVLPCKVCLCDRPDLNLPAIKQHAHFQGTFKSGLLQRQTLRGRTVCLSAQTQFCLFCLLIALVVFDNSAFISMGDTYFILLFILVTEDNLSSMQVVVEKARAALLNPGLTGEAAMPSGNTSNTSRPASHGAFNMGEVRQNQRLRVHLPFLLFEHRKMLFIANKIVTNSDVSSCKTRAERLGHSCGLGKRL